MKTTPFLCLASLFYRYTPTLLLLLPATSHAQVNNGTVTYGPVSVASIPTLHEVSLVLLALLIVGITWRRLRSEHRTRLLSLLGVGALLFTVAHTSLVDDLMAVGLGEHSLVVRSGNSFNTAQISPSILNTYTNTTNIAQEVKSVTLPDQCPQYPTQATNECRVGGGIVSQAQCEIDCRPAESIVALNFRIDDTANRTYQLSNGLAWKGSFSFNAASRTLTRDGAWPGPYPMLYDDGPVSSGGHEQNGSTASDNIWGVTVWMDTSVETSLEYGAISGSVNGSDGTWIWIGANENVTIPSGATGVIDLPGLVIPATPLPTPQQ